MEQNRKYDRKTYLSSLFDNDVIYYETALPLQGEAIQLLYPIDEVVSVTNYGLDVEYVYGRDYVVKDGKIVILPKGNINIIPLDEYYSKTAASTKICVEPTRCLYKFNEPRFLMFGESNFMSDKQIAITYKHKGHWDLFRQKRQSEKVNRFIQKLKNKQETTVVFYGDSITVGCNSSGTPFGGNVPPYAESWSVMITEYLKEKHETKINYVNTAVGGMATKWGVDNYIDLVLKYNPDLVVIGFGMNDGSLPKEEHIKQIMTIVDGIKETNPGCDIVLISTTVPNSESTWVLAQETYIEEYEKLDLDHVAIVDMTHMHLDLLKKKRFKDMSGNNINHPNDFLVRVYAQSILEVMGELDK